MKRTLLTYALLVILTLAGSSTLTRTFAADDLTRRAIERRAIEAVIWGMPAVNFDLMLLAFVGTKGAPNQVVYWSRLIDWKNQTLTPNPDTIYVMPFYDTKDGPVVLEIPPAGDGSITGSIDDAWQNALEDVGPAGADKGKGGKYLILSPGYKGNVPADYIPLRSETRQGFALLRSNLKSGSDADIAKAVAYGKRVKFYPFARANQGAGSQTTFVDAFGVPFDSTIPYDIRFFQSLDRFVQAEPWLTRDKAMIDTLRSIGIEKGKRFAPDADTTAILEAAAREARAWIEAHSPFAEGARWAVPASREVLEGMRAFFSKPDSYPTDGRAVTYSMAFFSAKRPGAGQFYLMTIKDKAGERLDGGKTYRLDVPANPPVTLYWSATVYDAATHGLTRNARWSSRSSNTPGCRRPPTARSMSTSGRPLLPVGNPTGCRPIRMAGSRCCSVSTVRRSHCSTRRGSSRTSNG
jgi:hypothetical protein